jgi:molybdopterin-guanine dinucleotide biosynthesis protein A
VQSLQLLGLCLIQAAKLSIKMMRYSAIILSGGKSTRMNGEDKGLILFQKKPLIEHVISRLAPQTNEIIISANREIEVYETFGYSVLQDATNSFLGPLAGFLLGLTHAKQDYVLTVPCDSPLLPLNLAQRLYDGMTETNSDIAIARSNGITHPVICLMKKNLLPSLQTYMVRGERKVGAWQKSQTYCEVEFSDCGNAFANLNSIVELRELELKL